MSELEKLSDIGLLCLVRDARSLLASEKLTGFTHAALQAGIQALLDEAEKRGLDADAPLPSGIAGMPDEELVRSWRNCRALARRRGTASLRGQLTETISGLEEEAANRRLLLDGWRPYPKDLRFGIRADGLRNVQHIAPPEKQRGKRKPSKPPEQPQGHLLQALEASLAIQANGWHRIRAT